MGTTEIVRLALAIEMASVVAVMLWTLFRRTQQAWRVWDTFDPFRKQIAWGQTCRQLCIAFFAAGVLQGQIVNFHEPLTLRTVLTVIAGFLGWTSWVLVDRNSWFPAVSYGEGAHGRSR